MASAPAERLRELKKTGGAGDLIAEVRTAQELLPDTRFASIEEGAISTTLVHLANISYRVGRTLHFDPKAVLT